MNNEADPLAQFGLEAIDLKWTLRDIAARRPGQVNKDHLAKLIELGLVAMRTRSLGIGVRLTIFCVR